MACGDVLSLEDLQTAKKHQIFEAEVITGKTGGVSGGASIDYATNPVTGQTQVTLPKVIRDLGVIRAGDFTAGCTVTARNQGVLEVGGSVYVWLGALPKVVPAGSTPESTGGISPAGDWLDVGDASLRTDLASESGDSYIGVGGGRTQADKNEEWVSVTDAPYLVKFDNGATDNTAALNAAFQSGKNIWIPDPGEGNFAQVTGTIYYDSKTVVRGPGKYKPVIKASASMPGELDLLAPINETYGVFSYLRNVLMFDLCVDANGFNRTKTVGYVGEWGRGIRIGAIYDSLFIRCNAIGGPQHGIDVACWKDNYIGIGHAGVAVGRPFNVILSECDSTDWVYDDGLTTHGCYNILIEKHTSRITDAAKALHTYAVTQKGIEIDDGSVGIVVSNPRVFGNGTLIGAFSNVTHPNNPAAYDVQWDNPWAHGCHVGMQGISNPATDVVFDSADWLSRNIRVNNLVFIKPTIDPAATVLASRALDFQGFVDCKIDGVTVQITDDDGTYSAPVSPVHFFTARRISVDNFKAVRVPGIPSGSYVFSRDVGWARIANDCADIHLDGFGVDNIGYMNRMITDTFSSALKSVRRLQCDAIPADGQTKIGIVSSATNVEYRDTVVPVGMAPYRIGRLATSYPAGNYRLNQTGDKDIIFGGLEIRSEALADNSQAKPGILFNRQFASASDPTGTLGKGSIAFRTTAAVEGRFSISAFHEDVNEYRPIIAVRSTNTIKSLRPVSDNAVACGEASDGRFTVICAATGTINTSDAREKTAPHNITDDVLDAWGDVHLVMFQWLEAIRLKGESAARWHFGVIAQQVRDAFLAHGLDGTRYGLLCYDEWEDEYQPVFDVRKNPETGELEEFDTGGKIQTRVAGDRWGIRPDQCLFLEAAYQRRRCDRIEERLAAAGI